MNRVFISLFSLAVLAGLSCRFVWETYYPSIQSVSVSPLVADLGNVVQRSGVVEAKFTLHNTTRTQVSITRTLSSCRCNDLTVENPVIPSGGKTSIVMQIKPEGLHGQRTISAHLYTDRPDFPCFEITATGDFGRADVAVPVFIAAPDSVPGRTFEWNYPLANSESNVEWTKIVQPIEGIDIVIGRDVSGYQGNAIILKGKSPYDCGEYKAILSTKFAEHESPTSIEILLRVRSRFNGPLGVALGAIEAGQEAKVKFAVSDVLNQKFRIESVTTGGNDAIEISTHEEKGRVFVEFSFLPESEASGFVDGRFLVSIIDDMSSTSTLVVPFQGKLLNNGND